MRIYRAEDAGVSLFRLAEVSSAYGALDDEGFTDGAPVTSHALRELCRNGNRQRLQGDLMLQALHRADEPTDAGSAGLVLMYADANWQHVLKAGSVAPRKKQGLTTARFRLRAEVAIDANLELFVVSQARPDPTNRPAGEYLPIRGTGALADYTKDDVVVWSGPDERISVVMRALLTGAEPLLDTATYGSPATGSAVSVTPTSLSVTSASWNTTAPLIEAGGHYVAFFNNSTDLVHLVEPRRIVATAGASQLHFWPPIPQDQTNLLRGSYFEIRELPAVRVASAALYTDDGSP